MIRAGGRSGNAPAWDCQWLGLAGRLACLPGEAVLEAGVAELVYRPDDAQHVALAGIFEEPHEPQAVCNANYSA